MMRITFYLLITVLMLISSRLSAQDEYLSEYIAIGLEQNLKIDQQRLEVQMAYQDIRQAKGMLLPSMDLNARYTRANGGRTFQMPLGDLMNPVYNTLNSLVGEGTFQNIQNQELNFNRTTDVDTRLSLMQPIYDPRLLTQNRIQEVISSMEEVNLSITKRDVVFDIKQSYFNYLKALKLKELLRQTRELVLENLRVSEVLFANDKVTEDAVWRSKTEVRKVDFQRAEAEKQYQISKRYFNLLLNRDMTDSIFVNVGNEDFLLEGALSTSGVLKREELEKLLLAGNVADQQVKMAASNNVPNFYLAFDAGFQGSSYELNSESDYYLASVVMSWNIFSGFKNSAQKQKAKIEKQRLKIQYLDVKNRLHLQVEEARLEYEKSHTNYQTTVAAEHEAKSNFKIVSRKYEEGLARQVELIDARTFMTNAAAENIIARYDLFISKAAYERATSSYNLTSDQ